MNIMRSPITAPVEPKRVVTLYQVPMQDKAGFMSNMMGQFIPMSRMESVYSTLKGGDINAILDECFCEFNNDEHINQHFLNYSMSVGDILQVDDDAYRCTMTGWEKL